jgi:hypothetical protein
MMRLLANPLPKAIGSRHQVLEKAKKVPNIWKWWTEFKMI